jgi:dTDP-4-dehydrorhamnose 3,5-epimerase
MRFLESSIAGVIVIDPDVFRDVRGAFPGDVPCREVRGRRNSSFVSQDNRSLSIRDTLRGLHMQLREAAGEARMRRSRRNMGRRG